MTGELAVVTGGGRGIGRAIVEGLARNGARVVMAGNMPDLQRREASELAQQGFWVEAMTLDVTETGSVGRLVDEVSSRWGTPAIWVNNAGADTIKPFLETEEDEWWRTLDVNLVGAMRCLKAVLPLMRDASYGRVVNIGSDAGRVGTSGQVVYSAAKAGILGLTRAIAREVVGYGVTVNAVCPGPTDTPLVEEILATPHPRLYQALERSIPMKRFAKSHEIVPAVLMFASRDSGYITGQTLSVSGGLTML